MGKGASPIGGKRRSALSASEKFDYDVMKQTMSEDKKLQYSISNPPSMNQAAKHFNETYGEMGDMPKGATAAIQDFADKFMDDFKKMQENMKKPLKQGKAKTKQGKQWAKAVKDLKKKGYI